jgi:hypothetical protein
MTWGRRGNKIGNTMVDASTVPSVTLHRETLYPSPRGVQPTILSPLSITERREP